MSKLKINLDATALGHSGCILDLWRTVIGDLNESGLATGGYKEKQMAPELAYGIAVHKFIDVAFKTKGNLLVARKHCHQVFDSLVVREHPKKPHLNDRRHLDTVCTNVWKDFIMEEQDFDLIELDLPCWLCRGQDKKFANIPDITTTIKPPESNTVIDYSCPVCRGNKHFLQPATEVTFDIQYYEDDYIIVNLCGTIDMIGKMRNGPYAIGDWKTSSSWDNEGYFQQYEMSRQLNMYNLAMKLMSHIHPNSVLGTIGSKQLSVFINAIFVNKDPNKSRVIRSPLYPMKPAETDAFQLTLDDKIRELSQAVKTGYIPKQGILNGHCIKWQNVTDQNFVKCMYWNVCKSPETLGQVLLKRDFVQKQFNPLTYNEV